MTGQARDEGESIKRSSTSKELKRRSCVGSCSVYARPGWRWCSGSLVIEVDRFVHELMC